MILRRLAASAILLLAACGDDGDGDLSAFCAGIEDAVTASETFEDFDPTDVTAATRRFEELHDHQQALLDDAPSAARADLEVVADFVDDLLEGLAETAPDEDRPAVYDELRPRFLEVEAANDRLAVFARANCD